MTKIKVGCTTFTVVRVYMHDKYGLCDRAEQTITISNDISYEKSVSVLLHEMIHAIYGETGMKEGDTPPNEEQVCVAVGNGLAQILTDADLLNESKVRKVLSTPLRKSRLVPKSRHKD